MSLIRILSPLTPGSVLLCPLDVVLLQDFQKQDLNASRNTGKSDHLSHRVSRERFLERSLAFRRYSPAIFLALALVAKGTFPFVEMPLDSKKIDPFKKAVDSFQKASVFLKVLSFRSRNYVFVSSP